MILSDNEKETEPIKVAETKRITEVKNNARLSKNTEDKNDIVSQENAKVDLKRKSSAFKTPVVINVLDTEKSKKSAEVVETPEILELKKKTKLSRNTEDALVSQENTKVNLKRKSSTSKTPVIVNESDTEKKRESTKVLETIEESKLKQKANLSKPLDYQASADQEKVKTEKVLDKLKDVESKDNKNYLAADNVQETTSAKDKTKSKCEQRSILYKF